MFTCKYCNKECKNKNSLAQHEIRCKDNPNKIQVISNFIAYNKYRKENNIKGTNQFIKAKELNIEVPTVSEYTKKKISNKKRGSKHTEKTKNVISEKMKVFAMQHPENFSYQRHIVKRKLYNGILFDSSWEVEVAKYLDSQNIKWERPTKGFLYEWNNSLHTYYPDFYLLEYDRYIEVKGFQREKDLYKWKSVDKLIIIKAEEINKIRNNEYVLGL